MALPKKGIRKITVGENKYYWTVKIDHQCLCLVLGIGYFHSPNNHITLFIKYRDPWLYLPEKVANEIYSITPRLIKDAIVFAKSNPSIKWNGGKESVFKYSNGVFSKGSFF